MESKIVELLEWDTDFFGFPVAQILQNRLDEKSVDELYAFCQENKIRLLQFKCDAHHRPSVLLAEENNFHFADVRMTYRQHLGMDSTNKKALPESLSLRVGCEADIPDLHDIIHDLYTHSRYYFDTNFPRDRIQIFYKNWIEKAIFGQFDDMVWVLCADNVPVGFCSAKFSEGQQVALGLVGVAPSASGKGMGTFLMQEILFTLYERNISHVSVVTQGRNYIAQRLYQRNNFLIEKIEIYYHRWFDVLIK